MRTYFQGKPAKVDETRVGELAEFPFVATHEEVQGKGGDHRCKELVSKKKIKNLKISLLEAYSVNTENLTH